jgi:hypothetical protein
MPDQNTRSGLETLAGAAKKASISVHLVRFRCESFRGFSAPSPRRIEGAGVFDGVNLDLIQAGARLACAQRILAP